uniref:Uncharacterized protein n=1 Tax=Oryza nivara TaxID=4536 RepID=A0A0E0IQ90_ORYNI
MEDDEGDEQEEHHHYGAKLRTMAEAPPYGHGDVLVRLPGVSCGAVPAVVGCEAAPAWWSSGAVLASLRAADGGWLRDDVG